MFLEAAATASKTFQAGGWQRWGGENKLAKERWQEKGGEKEVPKERGCNKGLAKKRWGEGGGKKELTKKRWGGAGGREVRVTNVGVAEVGYPFFATTPMRLFFLNLL